MRWLLALLVGGLTVQAQDIGVVVGIARRNNPTLSIASWEGDSNVLAYLKHAIQVSDWFDLVESKGDYLLQASYQAGANMLEIRLQHGDQPVAAFRRESAGGTSDFVVRHAVDELITRAFKNPGFCNSRLAMVKEINGIKEIYLAEFDGANPQVLTRNGSLSVEPGWGAGGKTLVYTVYNNHRTDVVLLDFAANSQRRIAAFPGLNAAAALAPSGTRAALTLSKDGNPELYLLDVNTRETTRLTRTEGVESSPTWSPDGKEICFVSDGGGLRPSLYIMSASGGTPRHLIRGMECVSPDWSPVSNRICFSIREGNAYRIAWLDPTSSNPEATVIVDAPGDWEAPSWAPDGRHIVCSRTADGRKGLVLLDSWYRKITPLKKYTGNDTLPAYSYP